MPEPEPPRGLRERKKVQTRLAIRREAFRLFDKQGYANTTIEQIADAADVSPRTFYRYFGVKEALLLSNDLLAPLAENFAHAPAELPIIDAYRHALAKTYNELSFDEREDHAAGEQRLYQTPEARGLIYSEYLRFVDMMAEAMVARPDAPQDALGRRVVAAAIVGVLMVAAHDNPMPSDTVDDSLTILGTLLSPQPRVTSSTAAELP